MSRPSMHNLYFARSLVLATSAALAIVAVSAHGADRIAPGEFRIDNGKVDTGTYTGWRLFHSTCHGCHGVDAVGTDLAPNLVESVQQMTPRSFALKVITSYGLVARSGSSLAEQREALRETQLEEIMRRERSPKSEVQMPAWGEDQKVKPHVLDLFAYLTARASGQLGAGEPQQVPDKP